MKFFHIKYSYTAYSYFFIICSTTSSSTSSDSFNYEDGEIEDYTNQKTKNTVTDGISLQTNVQGTIISTGSNSRIPSNNLRKIVNSNLNPGKVPQAKSESHSLGEEYSNSYNGGNNVKITDNDNNNGSATNNSNNNNNINNNNNNGNNNNYNSNTYPPKNIGTGVSGVSTANGRILQSMTPMAPRSAPIGNTNINNNINNINNNNNSNYNGNNRSSNIGKSI